MNNTAMSRRKSSHEAEVGRHGNSCCIESEASVVGIRLVVVIRASRGEISSGVVGTMTGVTGDKMSSRNGGTHGSPYASQRAIQWHKDTRTCQ